MKQVRDYYFHKAKQEDYAARSVYKLKEIHEKNPLVRTKGKVLDLGCYPGSWLQYLSEIVGPKGLVVGIDLQELRLSLPENVRFIQGDIFELNPEILGQFAPRYDAIVSDMAPKTTGIRHADAEGSYHLGQTALLFAQKWLKTGGTILIKIFQGSPQPRLMEQMKQEYSKVKTLKPKSSRKESVEVFLLGVGKKPAPELS